MKKYSLKKTDGLYLYISDKGKKDILEEISKTVEDPRVAQITKEWWIRAYFSAWFPITKSDYTIILIHTSHCGLIGDNKP